MLEKTINGLFVFTRYLVWALGVLGIVGSAILAVCNFIMGLSAVLLFVSTFLLSVAVTLLLMPEALINKLPVSLIEKRFVISGVALVIATVITGVVYFTQGGFPELNLIFM